MSSRRIQLIQSFRQALLALALAAALPGSLSGARVIEARAIPFTAFLPQAEFDERYPGEEVEDLSELKPGWYVIYQHESLSYYFGPILLESTGKDYLQRLTRIVEGAVAQRPSIQDYRLELSYEPSQSRAAPDTAPPSPEDPDESASAPPPPPPSGFWGFVRRVFGF